MNISVTKMQPGPYGLKMQGLKWFNGNVYLEDCLIRQASYIKAAEL